MIIIVTTTAHRYTHTPITRKLPEFRRTTYPYLFARRALPHATYIFTDFDRLSAWQLELAAHVYRVLDGAGARVLNDPARALQRLALLRRLHRDGVNSFTAWPAGEAAGVDRFPVFVRTIAAHRGNLTALLHDGAALAEAIEQLVRRGHPLADLMVAEYRAEPIRDDVFRKLSIYRLGDRMVAAPSVHERNWTAKEGEEGVAGEVGYAEDLEIVRTNPHAHAVRRAFEAARIEYGRADFGIVAGRPEIYEINTNPMMLTPGVPKSPLRAEALQLSQAAYCAALLELDSKGGSRISVPLPEAMNVCRPRDRLLPGYQWMP